MEGTMIVEVIWRGTKLHVEVNSKWTVKEFGENLLLLTNVKPDTLKLLVPQSHGKGSSLLAPFSDDNSSLNLQETGILKGKPVRMMGAFDTEVNEVSHNNMRPDLRIAGFDDEDKQLRQLSTYKSQASPQLPQGPYIFCDFRTLELPGIELNPPPSKALRIMHKLACDHGITAIMNKHCWRVGIMTELAPVGYVGISPKCILGFNKNHGEEISLRLRTDDLKGFRKYDSIKKTLLHELAHMVFSEHDAKFLALNKQLNEEAVSLDWTKSRSHTLSALKVSNHYEDEIDYLSDATNVGHKLGGGSSTFASARASSVEAAYHRYLSSHTSSLLGSQAPMESLNVDAFGDSLSNELDDIGLVYVQNNKDAEPDLYDALMFDNKADNASVVHDNLGSSSETSMIDEDDDNVPDGCRDTARISEIDNDDSHAEAILSIDEPDSYESPVGRPMQPSVLPETGDSAISLSKISNMIKLELDPDDSAISVVTNAVGNHSGSKSEEPDSDSKGDVVLPEYRSQVLKDSNSSLDIGLARAELDHDERMSDSENVELQSIEEPAAAICARIQEAIKLLRFELTSHVAASVLQTLSKIIRNIIDHPDELKFRRIRKANPQFQRNVANYKAAMDFLTTIGFYEDVALDDVGGAETYLVLKRNDPGLLWLAKSSLEVVIA